MGKIVVSKTRGKTLVAKMALAVLCVMALSVVMHGSGLNPDAQAASNSSLMHNSANTSTKYGTWGTTKDCSWCHNSSPASRFGNNIKFVLQNISTPTGVRQATFSRITAGQSTLNAMGVLGNDERSTLTTSTNICEVCHHKTTFHQYSASKLADRTHNNRSDCTTCHAHSAGFFASCASCHPSNGGLATNLATNATGGAAGAHDKHTVTRNMACETCHNGYTQNPMGNKQIEMSFAINHTNFSHFTSTQSIAFGTYSGGPLSNGYTWVGKTGTTIATSTNTNASCNVYCHGGWATSGAPERSWKSTMPTCTTGVACHFYNSATAPANAGDHKVHLGLTGSLTLTCTNCHPSASYDNGHLNGSVRWSLSGASFNANSKYRGAITGATTTVAPSVTYSSCSTTNCHGQVSPVWGSTVSANQCEKCHGSQSVAYVNFSSAEIAPGTGNFDTGRGTGVTTRGGVHQEHLKASSNISDKVDCGACHTVVTSVTDATHLNYTTASLTFKALATTGGLTVTTSRSNGAIVCNNTYCHTGNRTGATATHTTPTWNNSALLNGTISDCSKCHGLPPGAGVAGDTHETYATVNSIAGLSTCSAQSPSTGCHPTINAAPSTYSNIFFDKSKHINGVPDGGTCVSCHATAQGSRAATVGEFATQSHHVQGRGATNADCYKCHMEALDDTGKPDPVFHKMVKNSNAGINLVVWENNANGIRSTSTTYISYTANGRRSSIKKVNDHCLSCHNSKNAAFAPFVAGSTTDRYAPEQRLGLAKTSILSRYSSTRTVAWSNYLFNNSSSNSGAKYGTNQKSRVTKALSAHGNAVNNQFPQWDATANGRGDDEAMADSVAAANLSANRNVFCYDCHNSHGSNVTGITSSYSSATGRNKGGMLKTTVANQRGYTVTYTPQAKTFTYRNFSSLGQTLANVTQTTATVNPGGAFCNDCHNDDKGKTAYNYNRPWSPQATYSSSRAIVGYWSTPYFDNYTVYSAKRTTYKQGTAGAANDRRKPMGGHFGTSVGGTNGQASHGKEINGLCTPCHDPHGVSNALGNDRDHGVPLLKGTWVTSPYREDRAGVLVKRGGGSRWAGMTNMGAAPGYHIDQNTFMASPAPINGGASTVTAKGNVRSQNFRSFANTSSVKTLTGYPGATWADSNFAGLCIECHNQQSLTGASTNTASAAWLSKQRIHQSVSGWSSTNGTNSGNKVHAYTCSKCHAPHVSRLPRLLVTNCLDSRHFGRSVSTSIVSTGAGTNTPGNIHQSFLTSSALGAGRFPGGGAQYSGSSRATTQAQNIGGWWFQRSKTHGAAPSTTSATGTGSLCHNSTTAAGSGTYNPLLQKWNKKSVW